jgi:ABC-type uncharacterized transport system substrate-binding protein
MKRREFMAFVGGALALPLGARAQQSGAKRRIGIFMGQLESDPQGQARVAAFREGLRELKWVEGNNISIDIRWGSGDAAQVSAFAAELVSLAPDVILGSNTPQMRALKQATQTIPIVFAGLADPVGDGIVASLSKPGGNITGFSSFDAALGGKWLQLLKEISPGLVRVAIIFNPDTAPHSLFLPTLEPAAQSAGLTLVRANVRDTTAIERAIVSLASDPGSGLIVMPDVFVARHRHLIIALAARHRLPTVYPLPYFAVDGGLMAYGTDFADQFRRAAFYVDRVLQGAKPADLPVQAATKFGLVINLKTAKALGLTVPPTLLARADELIE